MHRVLMATKHVHSVPPKKGAGIEWWMYQVCKRLTGCEPHVVCIGEPGYAREEVSDGVHFHRIFIGSIYKRFFQKITRWDPYSYAHRMAERIDAIAPAVVHLHNAPELLFRLVELCRWNPSRWILHLHNHMEFGPLPPRTSLVAVSNYLREWYRSRHSEADVGRIANGVDLALFRPRWERSEDLVRLKARWRLPPEKKVVLYMGRISPEKGPLDLVKAFQRLSEFRDDVILCVAGELRKGGKDGDQRAEYGRQLDKACHELGERCRVLGMIPWEELHDVYAVADLQVVPSVFEEPFGVVVISGMASGIPVLAASKGGLKEFVREGETGFFIEDTKDYERFARRIGELLDRLDLLDQVRRKARPYVEAHHSWDEVSRQVSREYERLLAGAGERL